MQRCRQSCSKALLVISIVLVTAPDLVCPWQRYSDAYLTTPQLVRKQGYPMETHEVTSADGYVTSLHRLPRQGGRPVLLVHQLLGSSADWLLAGPHQGLGYLLFDADCDVWLANIRGNVYSKKHINMTTKDSRYWDFSFHEMGVYDLPATVDYILQLTRTPQLLYVSHSLGADIVFVMISTHPQYNDKIRGVFALAPGVFLNHSTSLLFMLASASPKLYSQELLPRRRSMADIAVTFCSDGRITQYVCFYLWSLVGGYNYYSANRTLLPVQLGHIPSGTSGKTVAHLKQMVRSGEFRQFDYGASENTKHYGNSAPPGYDLGAVTTPVALYYGDNDLLVTTADMKRLYKELKNCKRKSMKLFNTYSHFDFLWAVNLRSFVYDDLVKDIKQI